MSDKTFRRNNHYVPEFLLKNFSAAGKKGHIWEYRLLVEDARIPDWNLRAASRLAKTGDLYTVAEGAEESDQVERWLDEDFERPARNAVIAAINGECLNKEQWRLLIRFYAAQFVRTPAYFIRTKERWAKSMEEELLKARDRLLLELPKCMDTDSEFLLVEGQDGFPLRYSIRRMEGQRRELHIEHVTGRKSWMWAIKHELRANGLLARLEQYRWLILTAPEGVSWFLTDNPAVCIRRRPDGTQTLDGGWGVQTSKLLLPLGPKHLLYCQVGCEMEERYATVHPLLAAHLRCHVADAAFRSFYSHAPDANLIAYRHRKVDRIRSKDEATQWTNFGQDHSRAERFE